MIFHVPRKWDFLKLFELKNKYLIPAMAFSEEMVKARRKEINKHPKPDYKFEEKLADTVGKMMMVKNSIKKIKEYGSENKNTSRLRG